MNFNLRTVLPSHLHIIVYLLYTFIFLIIFVPFLWYGSGCFLDFFHSESFLSKALVDRIGLDRDLRWNSREIAKPNKRDNVVVHIRHHLEALLHQVLLVEIIL